MYCIYSHLIKNSTQIETHFFPVLEKLIEQRNYSSAIDKWNTNICPISPVYVISLLSYSLMYWTVYMLITFLTHTMHTHIEMFRNNLLIKSHFYYVYNSNPTWRRTLSHLFKLNDLFLLFQFTHPNSTISLSNSSDNYWLVKNFKKITSYCMYWIIGNLNVHTQSL